jgi:hypothetical protein
MTSATITPAQDKGLRQQFDAIGSVSDFCRRLWIAFGGTLGPDARRDKKMSATQMDELAERFEAYSPSLAAEIRTLAKRA